MRFEPQKPSLREWKEAKLPSLNANPLLTVHSEGKHFLIQNNFTGNNVLEVDKDNIVNIEAVLDMATALGGKSVIVDHDQGQVIFIEARDVPALEKFVDNFWKEI